MKDNITRRSFLLALLGSAVALSASGCSRGSENTVVVYSCNEGARNEAVLPELRKDLPQYDVRFHYVPTGHCAAKINMEKAESEADIVLALEGAYCEKISDQLEDLSRFDSSVFCKELLDPENKYLPFSRESMCVVANTEMLTRLGLPVPASYEDLTKPCYKDLISMSNPKSSGTAYAFIVSLVNAWGEDVAFDYFDRLAKNIYQFPASGSGPMNALIQGEAAIGFAMTPQTVLEINQGTPLKILPFEEGLPWSIYCAGIVDGKIQREAVRDVFSWLITRGVEIINTTFCPDEIFIGKRPYIKNYPSDAAYADMTNITDVAEKERLLQKWKY